MLTDSFFVVVVHQLPTLVIDVIEISILNFNNVWSSIDRGCDGYISFFCFGLQT